MNYIISAYSGPTGQSLWCDEWQCWTCGKVMAPETVDFATYCPLHNPMYCTGNGSHTMLPCDPIPGSEVFLLAYGPEDYEQRRTVIGEIP